MTQHNTRAYEQVADYIINQLENGVVPWRKPWTLPPGMFPQNLEGKAYRGINSIVLGMTSYQDPRWLTFRKAKEIGGNVRKSERGMRIVFWKRVTTKDVDDDGNAKTYPMLKTFTVFNVSQCEGLPIPDIDTTMPDSNWNAIEQAEAIIKAMPSRPSIAEDGGTAAFYRVSEDGIHMPPKYAFDVAGEYYSTLLHELSHSTGHPKRLNRDTINQTARFGSATYSKEELVAEFGAAYLTHAAGIENTIDNSASYIASWLKVLKNDKKLVLSAASMGQKAADHILSGAEVSKLESTSENTDDADAPIVNVSASYEGERNGYHVRGYEQAFLTEGHTSRGVRYWKANLIEMKRTAKADGLNYRRTTTRQRRKAA